MTHFLSTTEAFNGDVPINISVKDHHLAVHTGGPLKSLFNSRKSAFNLLRNQKQINIIYTWAGQFCNFL